MVCLSSCCWRFEILMTYAVHKLLARPTPLNWSWEAGLAWWLFDLCSTVFCAQNGFTCSYVLEYSLVVTFLFWGLTPGLPGIFGSVLRRTGGSMGFGNAQGKCITSELSLSLWPCLPVLKFWIILFLTLVKSVLVRRHVCSVFWPFLVVYILGMFQMSLETHIECGWLVGRGKNVAAQGTAFNQKKVTAFKEPRRSNKRHHTLSYPRYFPVLAKCWNWLEKQRKTAQSSSPFQLNHQAAKVECVDRICAGIKTDFVWCMKNLHSAKNKIQMHVGTNK